jgi:hypothetical protein
MVTQDQNYCPGSISENCGGPATVDSPFQESHTGLVVLSRPAPGCTTDAKRSGFYFSVTIPMVYFRAVPFLGRPLDSFPAVGAPRLGRAGALGTVDPFDLLGRPLLTTPVGC